MAVTVSYSLVPIPKWYFADISGKPLGGGSLYTYSNINPTIQKPVYQDQGGVVPWPNPILFDMNGEQGPFFWKFDTANPNDTYYLELYDAAGNLQWTMSNYGPGLAGGGGGGGTIATNLSLKNYIINGDLLFNIYTGYTVSSGSSTSNTPVPALVTLAPGFHTGISEADVRFVKSASTSVDTLSMPIFGYGVNEFAPTDVTPEFFFRYNSTNAGVETFKYVQWPIDWKVENFEGQTMSVSIWARNSGAGSPSLLLIHRQFFGTAPGGGVPGDVTTTIGTAVLTSSWSQYSFTFVVPSVIGKTLGPCGDDASYFQVNLPLSTICTVDFIKPRMYLGSLLNPFADLDTYDNVASQVFLPRTGDLRTSMSVFGQQGWVYLNDGTIGDGNQTSGLQARWNLDTFQLFAILWQMSVAYTPMYTQNGASAQARGVSAAADFAAHYQIRPPLTQGRLIAAAGIAVGSSGTNWVPGQSTGVESHVLGLNEIPNHVHGMYQSTPSESGGGADGIKAPLLANTTGIVGYTGQTALNLQNPVTYYYTFMKL